MVDYVIKIFDVDLYSVRIKMHYSKWDHGGSWFTLDKGALCYNAGACYAIYQTETVCTNHLYFYDENDKWGIRLKAFSDFWGVNKEGKGTLVQAWSIQLTPRAITWKIVQEL